jgi:hypothetical protein
MPEQEQLLVGQYESVMTNYDVIEGANNKLWLQMMLHGYHFELPLVNVGTEIETSAIGWLDPHPDRNPRLAHAAAETMTDLLLQVPIVKAVVMPTSSKSEWFIEQAVQALPNHVELFKFPGDKEKEKIEHLCIPESILEYTAVTGKKYIGVQTGQLERLKQIAPDGVGIVVCDDVKTFGGTLEAIRRVLSPVLYGKQPYNVVVARESEQNENYPPCLENGLFASIALPDMKGLFPADKLIHVTRRNEIPMAIVK